MSEAYAARNLVSTMPPLGLYDGNMRLSTRHASSCRLNDLDALRDRLDTAESRVAQNERLVAGWRATGAGMRC